MKKLFVVFLSLLCLFSLSACNKTTTDKDMNANDAGHKNAITAKQETGTFKAPVPLGKSHEVTDFLGNTYSFTVTDAYIGQEAVNKAETLDEYGLNKFDTEDGSQYVLVHYSITGKNLSGEKFDFNPLYINVWANSVMGTQILLYGDVHTSIIMREGTTDGWSAFSVDSLDSNPLLELQLDAVHNERSCWFSLK